LTAFFILVLSCGHFADIDRCSFRRPNIAPFYTIEACLEHAARRYRSPPTVWTCQEFRLER